MIKTEFGIIEDASSPPESLPALEEIVLGGRRIRRDEHLVELSRVIREAVRRNKYVIHFGI